MFHLDVRNDPVFSCLNSAGCQPSYLCRHPIHSGFIIHEHYSDGQLQSGIKSLLNWSFFICFKKILQK